MTNYDLCVRYLLKDNEAAHTVFDNPLWEYVVDSDNIAFKSWNADVLGIPQPTQNNIVENTQIGLRSANCAQLISNTNTNGTSGVQYGLYSTAGIIFRANTGQPSGTIAPTGTDNGGQVY